MEESKDRKIVPLTPSILSVPCMKIKGGGHGPPPCSPLPTPKVKTFLVITYPPFGTPYLKILSCRQFA